MTIGVNTWTRLSFMADLEDNHAIRMEWASDCAVSVSLSHQIMLICMQITLRMECGKMQASAITEGSIAGQVSLGYVTFLLSWEFHWSISNSISAYCKLLQSWIRANMAVRLTQYRERESCLYLLRQVYFNTAARRLVSTGRGFHILIWFLNDSSFLSWFLVAPLFIDNNEPQSCVISPCERTTLFLLPSPIWFLDLWESDVKFRASVSEAQAVWLAAVKTTILFVTRWL